MKRSNLRDMLIYMAFPMRVAMTFAGSVLLFFFVGRRLDDWLGAKGLVLALMVLLGIGAGGYAVYRQIMNIDRPDKH